MNESRRRQRFQLGKKTKKDCYDWLAGHMYNIMRRSVVFFSQPLLLLGMKMVFLGENARKYVLYTTLYQKKQQQRIWLGPSKT